MAFEITIRPRVSETDMIGHINNVAVVAWLEEGRSYMIREFALDHGRLPPFVLARLEVDYRQQIHFGSEIRVITSVERIGNSSATLVQEVRQGDAVCATGRSVLVHFDHDEQRTSPITGALRDGFSRHLADPIAEPR